MPPQSRHNALNKGNQLNFNFNSALAPRRGIRDIVPVLIDRVWNFFRRALWSLVRSLVAKASFSGGAIPRMFLSVAVGR